MQTPRHPRRVRSTRSGLVPTPRLSSGEPMSPRRQSPYVVGTEDALAELRAGRMVILMDDEDRENEGDLCVAAERVTAEHINFMATHGRGLVCLSLTERRCDQLGLPMMVSENRAPLGTAFTVSIDARHGIGRGISAVDRAATIRTAIRAEARITTRHGGDFRALVYTTDVDEGEHLVLAKGDIRADEPTLVRTHLEYLPGDVFGYRERDTRSLLQKAMERIAAEGKGVILYLRRDGRGLDLFSEPRADSARAPSTALGASWLTNFREFGIGAQILRDVGVGKIRWLTNRPLRLVSLPGYGLEIIESVPLTLDEPGLSSATPRIPRLFKVR